MQLKNLRIDINSGFFGSFVTNSLLKNIYVLIEVRTLDIFYLIVIIAAGLFVFDRVVYTLRRIGYKTTLDDIEPWVRAHVHGANHKCRILLRHRESGHYIEFCKWAPSLRVFSSISPKPAQYYLILREADSCSSSELEKVCAMLNERSINYVLETEETSGNRVLKSDIEPDTAQVCSLVRSIYKDCFSLPEPLLLRACSFGKIRRMRMDTTDGIILGWNDNTTLKQKMLAEQKKMTAEQKKYEGKSDMHKGGQQGWSSKMYRYFLEKNRKHIDSPNEHGVTPLITAAYFDNYRVADILLEERADIRAQDNSGRTALHCAAWKGHEGVAQLLLEHGAPTDITDSEGKTPLDLAKENDYPEIVRLLSETGEKAGEEQADAERINDSDVNQTSNSGIPEKEEFNE